MNMENIAQDQSTAERSTVAVNLELPAEIHQAAKISAASATPPITLRRWLAEAVQEKLERQNA
jgi:hypothetical protein